jgi:hypothetical protein
MFLLSSSCCSNASKLKLSNSVVGVGTLSSFYGVGLGTGTEIGEIVFLTRVFFGP